MTFAGAVPRAVLAGSTNFVMLYNGGFVIERDETARLFVRIG
jgi:hypothetical protein